MEPILSTNLDWSLRESLVTKILDSGLIPGQRYLLEDSGKLIDIFRVSGTNLVSNQYRGSRLSLAVDLHFLEILKLLLLSK